jgi:hypothetical protein
MENKLLVEYSLNYVTALLGGGISADSSYSEELKVELPNMEELVEELERRLKNIGDKD